MKVEVQTYVVDTYGRNAHKSVMVEPSHVRDPVADFAIQLICEWGKVPFEESGEDSKGRQKVRRLHFSDIVGNAFDAAELAYSEAFNRGHMVEMAQLRDNRETKEESE